MTLISAILFASLGLVALTTGGPVRVPREADNSPVHFVVIQTPHTAKRKGGDTSRPYLRNCIRTANTEFTTEVRLTTNLKADSYQLQGYSDTNCSETINRTRVDMVGGTGTVMINRRIPIRSFKLGHPTPKTIKVTFFKSSSSRNSSMDGFHMANHTRCFNLTANAPYSEFAQFVELRYSDSGVLSDDNHIRIFKDTNCTAEDEIASQVRHGAYLVDYTRVDPERVVRSFEILEDE